MTRFLLTHPDSAALERHAQTWLEGCPEARVLLPNSGAAALLRDRHAALTLGQFARRSLEEAGLRPLGAWGCEQVLLEAAASLALETLEPLLSFPRGRTALLEQLREFLRSQLSPGALLAVAESARERDLAGLYSGYLEGFSARAAFDPRVSEAFAARLALEALPTLVFGFPYLDAAQRALLDVACGPDSLLTLPWSELDDSGALRESGRVRGCLLESGWSERALEDEVPGTPASHFRSGAGLGTHRTCTASDPLVEVRAALSHLASLLEGGMPADRLALVVRDEATYLPLLEELALERGGLPLSGGMTLPLTATTLGKLALEVVTRLKANEPRLSGLEAHPLWTEGTPSDSPDLPEEAPPLEHATALWTWLEGAVQLGGGDVRHPLAVRALHRAVLDSESLENPEKPVSRATFLGRLEGALTRAGVPRFCDPAGIRVLTPLGTAGRRFEVLWVLGLAQDQFPASPRLESLLDAHARQRLRDSNLALRDLLERQDLEAALFHLAVSSAQGELILSRPQRDLAGNLCAPSPFWERMGPGVPLQLPEARHPSGLPEGEAQGRAERELARQGGVSGPHGGRLEQPFRPPQWSWSASQLHDFGNCRFKWFAGKLLGLRSKGANRSSDARARGHLAHLALQVLLEPFVGNRPSREALLEALPAALSEAEFRAQTSGEWLPEPLWPLERRTLLSELSGAVSEWKFILPGYGIQALEQRVQGIVALGGRDWTLGGIVDRLDARLDGTETGVLLTDYKSGSYISHVREPGAARAELEIQLPLYLLLTGAQRGRYFSLKRKSPIGDAAGPAVPSWPQQLERLNTFMADVVVKLEAGDVAADPGSERKPCAMCDLGSVCRLRLADVGPGSGEAA